MKAKLGIPPRWNRAPLLFDGALPKFNALVGRHPPGDERRGPPAECMRPDYGFDDAQAEVRAAPALSGRLDGRVVQNEVLQRCVIPAKAGIQSPGTRGQVWMPAFAGMTLTFLSHPPILNDSRE